ncbi:MAG: hypothetical protein AUF65_01145 [Chloroflexi bacterium 13_1_20CM_50_12]|nr:MAG: hypothetical protein AUF65_01145 [Chloroflexi bacterium 13_1_20CM_50_12]
MPILDDADLQDLANLVTDLAHKDDCLIEHTTTVDDPYGTSTPGTVTSRTVKCRVAVLPRPVLLQTYNEKIGAFSKWSVSFPLNTNPQEGDRLTINGQKMIVQIVQNPHTFAVEDSVIAALVT